VRNPIENRARVVLFSNAEELNRKRHRMAFLIRGMVNAALFIHASAASNQDEIFLGPN
jgi:hypothetical protein